MDNLLTPMDVEREMVDLVGRLEQAPVVVRNHYNALLKARQEYKKAYALAYSSAPGTNMDRRIAAELACEELAIAQDDAEIAYKYAVSTQDALKTKLRALQSVGSLMRAQLYGGS